MDIQGYVVTMNGYIWIYNLCLTQTVSATLGPWPPRLHRELLALFSAGLNCRPGSARAGSEYKHEETIMAEISTMLS
jgi:hypothetical protein